jgi:hypothetical protein
VGFSLCRERSKEILQQRRSAVPESGALIIELALIALAAGEWKQRVTEGEFKRLTSGKELRDGLWGSHSSGNLV